MKWRQKTGNDICEAIKRSESLDLENDELNDIKGKACSKDFVKQSEMSAL